MEKRILSIFARTPVHVGAGNSVGAIDAPVMRERHTRIPIIPGSSLKGVLADLWNELDADGVKYHRSGEGNKLFGEVDSENAHAGQLLIGEARALAFPVRSARGAFAWISCPLALHRLERDAGLNLSVDQIEKGLTEDKCAVSSDTVTLAKDNKKYVVLEEYQFECVQHTDAIGSVADQLVKLGGDPVWQEVRTRLVVVNDEMFSYFVEQACEVATRIRVDDETGTVADGALFNQEQVPSETMFYAVFAAENRPELTASDALRKVRDKLESVGNVLQIGGDETIGLGYCTVELNGEEAFE